MGICDEGNGPGGSAVLQLPMAVLQGCSVNHRHAPMQTCKVRACDGAERKGDVSMCSIRLGFAASRTALLSVRKSAACSAG